MRKDFFKAALTLFTVVICVATAMKYNADNSDLFGENIMVKPVFTDNLGESYDRLKQDLKDKYAELIYKIVDKIKAETVKEAAGVLSDGIISEMEEAATLKTEIETAKKNFYEEERYKSLQTELSSLRAELSNTDKEKSAEITQKMQKTMDEISTLNVTLKNRLKDKTERLRDLNLHIENEFDKNRDEIGKIKNFIMQKIKDEIVDCLDDFNSELALLNETFGKDDDGAELPFDESSLSINFPIFPFVSDNIADGKTFIVSENDDAVKN